jgi:hypothetical protein
MRENRATAPRPHLPVAVRGRRARARHRWGWLKPLVLAALVAMISLVAVGAASAHGDEEELPATDLFANAMALLQVHPEMVDLIKDKITDGLESADTEGVDLSLAAEAQVAFDAGDAQQALVLLSRATGMTPTEALASQTEEVTRPSEVPLADQLETPGSIGRPSTGATVSLALGAIFAIGLGALLVRRTK